jgi:hypothetical protein
MAQLNSVNERKLRRKAKALGYVLHKSRVRNPHLDNFGGYMLVDLYTDGLVRGQRYDLSLDDVSAFLAQ